MHPPCTCTCSGNQQRMHHSKIIGHKVERETGIKVGPQMRKRTGEKVQKVDEYKDTGVKVIEFNGEKFNFLAHRLYHYDKSNSMFCRMLMDDPSLWTKLDGATTLSCSSISYF